MRSVELTVRTHLYGPDDQEHEVDIIGTYSPARPAPAISPSRYDETKCDPGDPEDGEMLRVYLLHGDRMRLLDGEAADSVLCSEAAFESFMEGARDKWEENDDG